MTTTDKEQEAFSLVVERHKNGASENDIRTAFQRFIEASQIATASEMTTEVRPGEGNPGRMDLYLYNTCIEFKTNIVRNGLPIRSYIRQLDGYLENLLKSGTGVRNGILTDGVNYFLRRVGEEKLPLQQHEVMSIFDRSEQAPPVCVSTCMGSSRLQPKMSAPQQRTWNAYLGLTLTHSEPATCSCRKHTKRIGTTRQ